MGGSIAHSSSINNSGSVRLTQGSGVKFVPHLRSQVVCDTQGSGVSQMSGLLRLRCQVSGELVE